MRDAAVAAEGGMATLAANLAGKYLTFALGEENFGLEILKVREIIGLMDITAVPKAPEFVKGVINLRGKVIPVVDLRLRFEMPEIEHTEQTCIIVVSVNEMNIGVIVDRVREVQEVEANMIEQTPSFGESIDSSFILGMGKIAEKVVILLDIDRVLQGGLGSFAEQASEATL